MRRILGSQRVFFVLAFVCALLAAFAATKGVSEAEHTVPVVEAATTIPPWQPITSSELRVAQVAVMDKEPNTYSSPATLVGGVPDAPIPPGTQIRSDWINTSLPEAQTSSQSLAIQLTSMGGGGERALTIPVTSDEGLGNVSVGSRVDLLANVKVPISGQSILPATVMLARNVEVLAVSAPGQGGGCSSSPTGSGGICGDVTLLVTPALAMDIAYAEANGSVSLLLNGYNTNATAANLPPVTAASFLSQYGLVVSGTSSPPFSPSKTGTGNARTPGQGGMK